MNLLQLGSTGADVIKWQYFLLGQNLYFGTVNGQFDDITAEASKKFQRLHQLKPDGLVGNKTIGKAMQMGFGLIKDPSTTLTSDAFPAKPNFKPLTTNAQRQKLFGELQYKADPKPKNPENIKITNNWDKQNIVKVSIKQLTAIKGSDTVYFHTKAAKQLEKLFNDWEKANMIKHILTWDGAYNPRFVRGSKTVLSNHAFGTAFDINVAWNRLGTIPALVGQKGSVRELVKIAHDNGFYWGGHFTRRDGMHFEVAKVM